MRFDFRLRPLDDIAPFHDADGSNPHLGWYGLTDGWYWIEVEGAELFRYSRAVLDNWALQDQDKRWLARMKGLPYVDYAVAKLWGDVLDFLPDVLEPVPPQLAHALATDVWSVWEREAETAVTQALPVREARNLLYDATRWLGKRKLDSAYLVSGPKVWCWSDGTEAHIRWDNRERTFDGLPIWEATVGHHTMPVAAFREAVRDFDARFIQRMAERVAIAQAEWPRSDVALDPDLADSQRSEAQWSQGCLAASSPQEPDHWDLVFEAIARIEALPHFTSQAAERLF
jgi:hypothetical protein